jgi:hypothetical protein
MNRMWMAAIAGMLVFGGATAFAGDAPEGNGAVLRARLKGALGARWSVRLDNGVVVAKRMRVEPAGANTKSQIEAQEFTMHERHPAMTVAVENGQARFVGETEQCDAIVDSANEFAQIRGIDELVVVAQCQSR